MNTPAEIEVFHMLPRDYKLNWGSMKLIRDAVTINNNSFCVCCTMGMSSAYPEKIGCWIAYFSSENEERAMIKLREHITAYPGSHSFAILKPYPHAIPSSPSEGIPVIMTFNEEMTMAR